MEKEQIACKASLVIIGGSSGSLEVILKILPGLPTSFRVPVLILLHRNSNQESALVELLAHKSGLIVKEVEEKESIVPGCLYVAPADFHVLFEKEGTFSLDYSEKVNFSRPSIDVSFVSAADVFGTCLVCILLSGANADGAEGMHYAKRKGATTLVQDPLDAIVPFMPRLAIEMEVPSGIMDTESIRQYLSELQFAPISG